MKLLELIGTHADALTREALKDLATNPRTRAFHLVPRGELEARVFAAYDNLGTWIGNPSDEAIRADYESWGAKRFRQGIPLSEIVYALILIKDHLRGFVRDHGLAELAGDRDDMVCEFFDRVMYHLARGYEAEASRRPRAASA